MGKRTGQHPHKELSPVSLKRTMPPGRYADGNGLYLLVDPSGAKRWILRTVVQGRGRTDIGLGGLSLVTLAEAREEAARLRKIARRGGDPIAERRRARTIIPTFEEAARAVHQEHSPGWRNPKHAAQWITTLETYAFPLIGSRRVDAIGTPEVLSVLAPIWLTKPETARRVRQRIGVVLDSAKAKGHRSGDNPVGGATMGLPKQNDVDQHHAALPYDDVPAFIESLRGSDAGEGVRLAFEFLILTAARTNEVINAAWSEIDEAGAAWNIPGERMKAKRVHRVPLVPRALAILKRARELAGDGALIFPGRDPDKPMSNMAFLMLLRRMGVDTTAHGFRSSFRDWASETTGFPHELCEAALAHVVKNKTEAAYRRGDLFEKRRELMLAWARHCEPSKRGDVVSIRARKRV